MRGRPWLRGIAAAAVCALAAHALAYRTLWPADGVHGYFGWYEPLVAAASLASLAALLAFAALAHLARRAGRPLRVRLLERHRPTGAVARSFASSGLLFVLVQESIERSVAAGHPAVASFGPAQWLVLLAGLAVASALLAVAMRASESILRRVLEPKEAAASTSSAWSVVTSTVRRSRALSGRFALRAPPLPTS
jgi:hypothetical protein